jgi:hypothetical protein
MNASTESRTFSRSVKVRRKILLAASGFSANPKICRGNFLPALDLVQTWQSTVSRISVTLALVQVIARRPLA